MGELQIPIRTYHRSESGKEGSIVLNQATRATCSTIIRYNDVISQHIIDV